MLLSLFPFIWLCATELGVPASDGLRRKRDGKINAARACFNILNPPNDWLLGLSAEERRNISHDRLAEVKEILKKLGDDSFGKKTSRRDFAGVYIYVSKSIDLSAK